MRPANDQTQSLRYLLLRHAWRIKNRIPDSIYRELTSSLNVSNADKDFLVTWMINGIQYEKKYDNGEFNFFTRGDKVKDGNNYSIDYTTNNNIANSFVIEAFGLEGTDSGRKIESLLPINPLTFISYIAVPAVLWFYGGEIFLAFSGLLLLLFASEFWYIKGKLFVPLFMLGFIQNGLVFTPLVGIVIFLLYQLLDPNKMLRKARILISTVSALIIISHLIRYEFSPYIDSWIILVTLFSTGVFMFNWVVGSHFRSFPLVFPFLAVGLYIDGYIMLSIVNLVCALTIAIIVQKGFNVFPVKIQK